MLTTGILQRRHAKAPSILARFSNNRIQLSQQTMYMLQNSIKQQINIICLQNFLPKNFKLFAHSTTSQKQKYDNCILFHTYITEYPNIRKNMVFCELIASSPQAKTALHTFISCFAYAILASVGSQDDVRYLGHIVTRVAGLGQRGVGARTAGLFCIMGKPGQRGQYITDKTDQLMQIFEQQAILQHVISAYPIIYGFECPQSCLVQQSQFFQQKLIQQIDSGNRIPRECAQLMYGPILTSYMQNIVYQLNNSSQPISLQRAQNDIVIDEGYAAYRAAVKKYHQHALNNIDVNAKPDDNQLQHVMDDAKNKAFSEFYAYEGSNNLQYRRMLEQYTKQKGQEVVDTYSKEQWNKNLQILQSQSNDVLNKISQTRTKDPNQIMGHINNMTRTYERNARGPQKYQILNDYMKVFTPIALEDDPEKQARLRKQLKRNEELQRRLAQLKKKKSGGCCSSCQIM